jgi:molecular chaperone IbpA
LLQIGSSLTLTRLNLKGGKHMTKNLSIFNNLRPITVGFDNVFDQLEYMMDDNFFRGNVANFPPYNIVKTGENTYDVELALAGFNKKDIDIEYKENVLIVKSKKQDSPEEIDPDGNIIHRGISKRMFSKSFTIANDVEVKGAELKDGLLKVTLERIVPEHKKAKTIEIK